MDTNMDRGLSPTPKPAAVTEFAVVPPGPINKHKRHILAKFVQSHPGLAVTPNPTWKLAVDKAAEKQSAGRSRMAKPPNATPPLVLERVNAPGEVLQKGVSEGSGGLQVGINPQSKQAAQRTGSTYYLFVKAGKEMLTAYPVDMIYSFKPPPKRGGMSLEDAEARMRADKLAAESIGNLKLVPKSVEASAKRRLEEELAANPSKGKGLTMDHVLNELLADDGGAEDGLGISMPGRKGRKPVGEAGAGQKRKPKSTKAADGTELDVDELAEDIYEGLGGEGGDLRPTKPEPAEDWEHEEQRDDDDLSQGQTTSDDWSDDPGLRKKLGLEGNSDGEEEEDEAAKKLKQRLEQEDEVEGEEKGEQEAAAVDTTTADVSMGDEDDDLDLDEMATSQLGAGKAGAAEGGGAAKRKHPDQTSGGADASAKRARVSAPAPAPAAAAPAPAKRPVSPAPATTKPGAAGVGQAGARVSSGGTSSAGTAPAAAAGSAAGTGIPTPAEIRAAVQAAGGSMTSNMLRQTFSSRLRGPNLEALIKGFKDNMKVVLKPGAKSADGSIQFVLK